MELIKALGLDWKILIAQLVNFSILLFVLWKFGYKPILKFLDDRKEKIEKGITNAEKATKKIEEARESELKIIKNAKKTALNIINEAKNVGEEKKDKIIKKAKEEIGEIINNEKEKLMLEKADILKEIKKDTANLIFLSVEKILNEKMNQEEDKKIIKKIIKNIK